VEETRQRERREARDEAMPGTEDPDLEDELARKAEDLKWEYEDRHLPRVAGGWTHPTFEEVQEYRTKDIQALESELQTIVCGCGKKLCENFWVPGASWEEKRSTVPLIKDWQGPMTLRQTYTTAMWGWFMIPTRDNEKILDELADLLFFPSGEELAARVKASHHITAGPSRPGLREFINSHRKAILTGAAEHLAESTSINTTTVPRSTLGLDNNEPSTSGATRVDN
jgi:hypothetical protein